MSHPGSNPFGLLGDPMLPHLRTALDVTGMAERFTARFRARGAACAPAVTGCAIERIYYRPGRHCGLLYRLTLRNGSGVETDEWVFGRLVMRDRLHVRLESALAVARDSHATPRALGGMDPVSLWDDLDMILWVFPQDRKLPALPRVVDPGFVRGCIAANLARFAALAAGSDATAAATGCAGVRFERVKYMPDKRCVLRYHADLVDAQGRSRTVTFFGKTYPDARSVDLFASQCSAWEQLTAQGTAVGVPRPLLHLDAEHTIWLEDWGGRPLIEAARERSWDELVARAAAAVAALHCSRIAGFAPAPTPDQVLQTALEEGPKYAGRVPTQRGLVIRMLEHLRSAQPAPDATGWPRVPIHGACRAEQMLVRGAETALIDLDALAEGDPLLDVAQFVASLEFLALSGTSPGLDFARASERFLESYAARVPWSVDRRRVGWYALAFAIGNMHASVRHLEMATLARLEREGEALAGRWLEASAGRSAKKPPARSPDTGPLRVQEAADPESARAGFQRLFDREYGEHGLTVHSCRVSRLYVRPGRDCSFTYQLRGDDRSGRPFDQWFHGRMLARWEERLARAGQGPGQWEGYGFWKPVLLWPEMHMVLHAFPYDPAMPFLGRLVDPAVVGRLVDEYRNELGLDGEWRGDVSCTVIKYRPGKHCVLRYELHPVGAAPHASRPLAFYGKSYAGDGAGRVYESLRHVRASVARGDRALEVPRPIAHVGSVHAVWQEAWDGEKLVARAREVGWARALAPEVLDRIAAAIAALHRIEWAGPPLEPAATPERMLRDAHDEAADLVAFVPEQEATIAQILDALASSAPPPDSALQAPIHGTFKIAQILWRDDTVALVDFDAIAIGDPLYDIAEFIASVLYLGVTDGVSPAWVQHTTERFVTTYQARVPWACDPARWRWYAAVFLLAKIHASLKTLGLGGDGVEPAFELILHVLSPAWTST